MSGPFTEGWNLPNIEAAEQVVETHRRDGAKCSACHQTYPCDARRLASLIVLSWTPLPMDPGDTPAP